MIGLLPGTNAEPAVQERLSVLAGRHQVPGVQLALHREGHTVLAQAGERVHRGGDPVTADTAFPIGSITKAFTATLVGILAADDDLDLDEPVSRQLPELGELRPETGLAPALTLRHLLSHTGGLPAGPDSADIRAGSLRRYVSDHCRGQQLLFAPGTAFSYSNAGYVIAGRLIEVATGMSWAEAVEAILLRPLHIEPSFITDPTTAGRCVASGHSVNRSVGRVRAVRQELAAAEAPAGALAVSAADLVELALLHIDGSESVLPADEAADLRDRAPGADAFGLAAGWGLGVALFGDDVFGHDGNAFGTSCYLRASAADGWVVALTTNANTGAGLWRDLLDELPALGIDAGPDCACGTVMPVGDPLSGGAAGPLPGAAGCYRNGDVEFAVTVDDGHLALAVDGDPAAPLVLYPDRTFAFDDPSSGRPVLAGRFGCDPVTGRVDSVQLSGRLARRRSGVPAAARLIA
jgi:CubicO group peptidase (beta-lactamase class C family)